MPRDLLLIDTLLVVLGLALLVGGGDLLVRGAGGLALLARVTPAVVGVTVVAAGTSMPELVVSMQSALDGRPGLAMGNIVGSNIFNVLGIGGATALVRPLPVPAEIIARDDWWMLAFSFLLFPLMWTGRRINRVEGAVLLGGFTLYIAHLLGTP